MVLLERLSSNNFENFKTLNIERFSKENYDKNSDVLSSPHLPQTFSVCNKLPKPL